MLWVMIPRHEQSTVTHWPGAQAPGRPGMVGTPPPAGRRPVRPGQDQSPEVAGELGVSAQTASRWYTRWRDGGAAGMRTAARASQLGPAELAKIRRVLDRGAVAAGFDNDLWTLARVAEVIEQTTGVAHHPGHVWRLLKAMGWSLQRSCPQGSRAQRGRDRPLGRRGVAADQANAQRAEPGSVSSTSLASS